MGSRNLWLKLAAVAGVAGALVYHLTRPIPTHAVIVDMSSQADIDAANRSAMAFYGLQFVAYAELLGLAGVIWLGWKIIRNHRQRRIS